MKFAIITHELHYRSGGKYLADRPFVEEMNIWLKKADEVFILAPLESEYQADDPFISYKHERISFGKVPQFNYADTINFLRTLFLMPFLLWKISGAMKQADHIHIRCPGNIGLLASFIQIFFRRKPKTIMYDGNWANNTTQPFSYRLQKWILKSGLLTKNARVLIYGDFGETNPNIVPFFKPVYSEDQKIGIPPREPIGRVKFLFAASLTEEKNPLLACRVIHLLKESGMDCELNLYGEGPLHGEIDRYIHNKGMSDFIKLMGIADETAMKAAFCNSHFLLCFSKSQSWPKVIAEAMWWACLPVASPVSCIPQMLADGERGLLVYPYPESVIANIKACLNNPETYLERCRKAMEWSRNHSIEKFEEEVHQLLDSFENS